MCEAGGDRPHAPLDIAFAHLLDNPQPEAGRLDSEDPSGPLTIWSSYSNHTHSRYHYIFGADAAQVYPKDLLLAGTDTAQQYLAINIAETPKPSNGGTDKVTWGSSASVQTITPTAPLKLVPSAVTAGATTNIGGAKTTRDDGVVPFSYVLLAPIADEQRVVMLGEMDKVVPASTHRFHENQAGEWTLTGAPAETVIVSFAVKDTSGSIGMRMQSPQLTLNYVYPHQVRYMRVENCMHSDKDSEVQA